MGQNECAPEFEECGIRLNVITDTTKQGSGFTTVLEIRKSSVCLAN